MVIQLDEKIRIRGTTTCWQLEELRKTKGEYEWRPFLYYGNMHDALRGAAQREIRTTPAAGINEAIAACHRVTEKYSKLFDGVGVLAADNVNAGGDCE